MPALSFLAIVGFAVITFLFVAKATPELGSPVIVTSQHSVATAPAPDTTPRAVLAAQPRSAPDAGAKIPPAARVHLYAPQRVLLGKRPFRARLSAT